ncbi:MAG TPA: YciI family protein [Candidatus Kapabacteria bacterium]|nr:YciI family protein [Candidatus Kapabacteria bacterium]
MRFLMMWYPDQPGGERPPDPGYMERMDRFVAAEMEAGVLQATGGLLPTSMGGATITARGGKFMVTDGPFTESKEMIAGFAIVNVASLEEAVDAARRFTSIAGEGECGIRQIIGGPENL